MITNPYKVLGVPDGASEAECTKAYKRLAKKYHPDLNPGDKTAEKKMAEINAAYDQIKNGYASGGSASGSYANGGFGSYSSRSSRRQSADSAPDYLSSAAQFIKTGQYAQALNLLNTIEDRNAKWYYLSALANMAQGNRTVAEDHIRTAYAKEPDNLAYRQAYEDIKSGVNPLNDNPIYTFFDFGDRPAGAPPQGNFHRSRSGCLGRIIRFIIIIIVIRLVVLLFSYGASYVRQRNYYSNQTPYGYSQQYDGGEIFGDSSGEGANA